MASVARFSRLAALTLRRRCYSSVVKEEASHLHCYLVGINGQFKVPADHVVPLSDYLKENGLLHRVPADRLIENIDEKQPFQTEDKSRKLIPAGLLPLYFCKKRGLSIAASDFREDNIGVLKGMDTIVFRSLNLSPLDGNIKNCYGPFVQLLKSLLSGYMEGPQVQLPMGLNRLVSYLESPVVKDHLIIYNAALFPRIVTAALYSEIYRILREQCPARGLVHEANQIIKNIEQNTLDFMDTCSTNPLLISYSGTNGERAGLSIDAFASRIEDGDSLTGGVATNKILRSIDLQVLGKKTTAEGVTIVPGSEVTKILVGTAEAALKNNSGGHFAKIDKAKKDAKHCANKLRKAERNLLNLLKQKGLLEDLSIDPEGPKSASEKVKTTIASPVVDTHRHGIIHAIKPDNEYLVKYLPEANKKGLEMNPYGINDVVDLFQYKDSEFLSIALDEFDSRGLWELLDMANRFPIPDVYML